MPFSADLSPWLSRLIMRSRLTDFEQQAILELPTHTLHVRANIDFVRLDEDVDHVSLVADGIVGQFDQTAEGTRQITALHLSGDAADLHSVVLPRARSALQALTPVTILRVSHAQLRSVMARYHAIAEAFWRDGVVDQAIQSQWLVNLGRRDAKSRVAHLLCELACRTGTLAGNRAAFSLPITQQHLSEVTGLTAVHVNRTLRALREATLIQSEGRQLAILDFTALARAGDFNAGYLQLRGSSEQRDRIVPLP